MPRILRRVAWWITSAVLLLAVILAIRCLYAFRDRSPGYALALDIDDSRDPAALKPLRVGFARVRINPDLGDPRRPIWIAGFGQHRAATAIHDDLWAVACVLDDGVARLGIVSLDAIGLFHDDVISVRRRISPASRIDYAVVCSTHNHSTPDLLGLWGPDRMHTGVDDTYRRQVISSAANALDSAAAGLQPARVAFHQIALETTGLVADGRRPEIFDPDIRVMHFTRPGDAATIGTLVNWSSHPETPWSKNTELTADYPGYLRDALAQGVTVDGRLLAPGLGGIHLYVNGAIGGLMTISPDVTVHDPYLDRDFKAPSHEKARAAGRKLFSHILPALTSPRASAADRLPISIHARTLPVKLDNSVYYAAQVLGLIDRGHSSWGMIRSEVALLRLGEAAVACVPGEVYPEIVNGGIENPPGADFRLNPVEVPPLREVMPGKIKFVFGLASDEIGYLIPKSEWDEKPPYLYGSAKPIYGEINSCGPDTAQAVHQAIRDLCRNAKP